MENLTKNKKQNQSLVPFLRPAFKRTISILSAVADFVDDYKFFTNWDILEFQGWHLPAIAEPHYWCGLWKTIGCLNVNLHEKLGKGGLIYIKKFQQSCYRPCCKICYLKWIARQANAATRRIEAYQKHPNQKPIHLILIVNKTQHDTSVKILRQRMSHILKLANIEGCAVVFHPFRFNKELRTWYPYPHFHLVGFGNKNDIKNAFGRYGWYVKDAGERHSVFQTFCYLLSHCGVKSGYKTVTWYGKLSYSNLHVEKEPKITKCPVCGGEFEEIYYLELFHPVVPPSKPYEGLVDAEGWYPVGTEHDIPTDFDYAPTRELNENLKGLALAN